MTMLRPVPHLSLFELKVQGALHGVLSANLNPSPKSVVQAELAPRQSRPVWRDASPELKPAIRVCEAPATLAPSGMAARSAAAKLAAVRNVHNSSEARSFGGEPSIGDVAPAEEMAGVVTIGGEGVQPTSAATPKWSPAGEGAAGASGA